jgi:sortase A
VDVRRAVRAVGKSLIAAGVLILLFVAYQLWGTGLAEARAQARLTKQFNGSLSAPSTTTTTTSAPSAPVEADAPPPPLAGEAVGILKISKLGLEKAVVEGVSASDLKKGPGHYPGTPMPGQPGNASIAGHRTTYGAPFNRLDELGPGDDILVTTREGEFRYEVSETKIVRPTEVSVLDPTADNRLTLTTCHPKYSAALRLIVVASLASTAVDAPPPPVAPPSMRRPPVSQRAGLSGEGAENGPAVAWGAAAAAVWWGAWWVGRRWRRWPAYAVGTPVFLVVLFFFFENFSRLLPANF